MSTKPIEIGAGHRRRVGGVLRLAARHPQHAVVDDEGAEGHQPDQRDRDLDQHGSAFRPRARARVLRIVVLSLLLLELLYRTGGGRLTAPGGAGGRLRRSALPFAVHRTMPGGGGLLPCRRPGR